MIILNKILIVLFFSISLAKTSLVNEGETYEIRDAFVMNYMCYIQVQRKNLQEKGLLLRVPCKTYLKRYFSKSLRQQALCNSLYSALLKRTILRLLGNRQED